MYEKTILSALKQYHVHIGMKVGLNDFNPNSSLANQIKVCEEYIEQGNIVTTHWMEENHTVVSKAVKYALDFINRNYTTNDSEYSSEEHKELKLCVRFFTDYYNKSNIDCKYMDIDF